MFQKLQKTISSLKLESISAERKQILKPLIDYIQNKISNNLPVILNFICTHNSRRSHLSQVWAQVFSHHYNLRNVYCYSGGSEETAMFFMVVKVLEDAGLQIEKLSDNNNPVYSLKYSENSFPIICFSKKYDNFFNPKNNFCAIMTCSNADENCPIINGAEKRIPIKYRDPKEFDNTEFQKEKYRERSAQIATEMMYVFSKIKTK